MKVPGWLKALLWALGVALGALVGVYLYRRVTEGRVEGAGDPWVQSKEKPGFIEVVSAEYGAVTIDPGMPIDQVRAAKVVKTEVTVERKFDPRDRRAGVSAPQ